MTVSLLMSYSLFYSIRDIVSTRPKGFSWFWLLLTQAYAGDPNFVANFLEAKRILRAKPDPAFVLMN